jgi:3-oxoacyl-[acyl-carrier-protein] synthase-1
MNEVYIASDNIITSLGFTTEDNCTEIKKGATGITLIDDPKLEPNKFYASVIDSEILRSKFSHIDDPDKFTRFEQLAILSINDALNKTSIDVKKNDTLFILSTTKGNIDVLEKENFLKYGENRLFLHETAKLIQQYFGNPNTPMVISNACISGVLAIIAGSMMIRSGRYKNVIITGADILSKFVVSGFQSFQSLSSTPCKPFDKTRDGLSIGEGCATIVLTSNKNIANNPQIIVGKGSSSNDANHISGPSRTGEGLYQSIKKTIGDLPAGKIDFISAHGTATPYNDEMEAIAFTRAGLENVPVNSFKGYFGHTLGAAGVIESVLSIYSLKNNILFGTAGFSELGVSSKINIIDRTSEKELSSCLKTASGFGGCNASIIFHKI